MSLSWTTSIGNSSRSSKLSTNNRIRSLLNPLRAGTCLHSECLRSLTVAGEGKLLKLDQTFVIGSGGMVKTRILIDIVCDQKLATVTRSTLVDYMRMGLQASVLECSKHLYIISMISSPCPLFAYSLR